MKLMPVDYTPNIAATLYDLLQANPNRWVEITRADDPALFAESKRKYAFGSKVRQYGRDHGYTVNIRRAPGADRAYFRFVPRVESPNGL